MITKKTDKAVRKALAELFKALNTNRLKAWEQGELTIITAKLDAWVKSYGRPEERGK